MAAPAGALPLLSRFVGTAITGPVVAWFNLDSHPVPDRINVQSAFGFGAIGFSLRKRNKQPVLVTYG